MKAILLSIRPEHLLNILNGKKTIEIRKSKLPLNVPVYLYCTKGKPFLANYGDYEYPYKAGGYGLDFDIKNIKGHGATLLNGKIVAKCVFSEVEEIACERLDAGVGYNAIYYTETRDSHEELCELACLDISDLKFYLGEKDKGQIVGYAYHISNLEIFDNPKGLGEFYVLDKAETKRYDGFCKVYKPITKAPKSWCYVEE